MIGSVKDTEWFGLLGNGRSVSVGMKRMGMNMDRRMWAWKNRY